MKTYDYYWVGLKLLGFYLVVTGLAQLATCIHLYLRYLFAKNPAGVLGTDYLLDMVYLQLSTAGVHLLAGAFFVCCSGLIAGRRRFEEVQDLES
jgi:hypothetical protein